MGNPQNPETLPADFFSKPTPAPAAPITVNPDKLPADFFSEGDPGPAHREKPGALANFGSHWWDQVNPWEAIKGINQAAWHPIEAVKAMGVNNQELARRAAEAWQKGDPIGAAAHAMYYLANTVPGVGTALDKAGEEMKQGDWSGGLGDTAGVATNLVGPEAVSKIPMPTVKVPSARIPFVGELKETPNPKVRAAVAEARTRGITPPLGTVTENPAVQGLQQAFEHSPTGSMVAQQANRRITDGLVDWGRDVADDVHPARVTPVQAGMAVEEGLDWNIGGKAAEADAGYAEAWRGRGDANYNQQVPVRTRMEPEMDATGAPTGRMTPKVTMADVNMPVDVRGIKMQAEPIFEEMKWMPASDQAASAGFMAVKKLLEGDDFIPAWQAEHGLSGLKSMARVESSNPAIAGNKNFRNQSQGIAAGLIPDLQQSVDAAVAQTGPDAIRGLMDGRAATAGKAEIQTLAKRLAREPANIFGQLTFANDAGVRFLQRIQQELPDAVPKIGRAWLDDVLDAATSAGGFDRARALWNWWDNLGPETRKIIFPKPGMVDSLDNLFLLTRKLAERPNTSGSAVVGGLMAGLGYVFAHPVKGIPMVIAGAPLTEMMYNPRAIKLLTEGTQIPISNQAAARAAQLRILNLAGRAAQPLEQAQPQDDRPPLASFGR